MNPPIAFRKLAVPAASLAMLVATAQATQVVWDVSIGQPNSESSGRPWQDMMVLELGTFVTGFNPAPNNTALWAANWQVASRTSYYGADRYYSASANFTTNAAPFTQGASAWIWGVRGNEWILYRKTGWIWPVASSIGGPPLTWTMNGNTSGGTPVTIVGSAGGSPFRLTTATVTAAAAPPLCWADWRLMAFADSNALNDATLSSPSADTDGDGRANFLEYLAGTRPTVRSNHTALTTPEVFTSGATNYLGVRLNCDPRACFSVAGQVTTGNPALPWTDVTLTTRVNSPGVRLYTPPTPIRQVSSRELVRLKLSPAP